MKSYTQFWEELKSAYPITHGELKLPIAVELETFSVNFNEVIKNLDDIMQQIFQKYNQAVKISKTAFSQGFTDLFTGEFTGIVRFDTMFDQDGELKLVEVNTKWPDGLLMHDNTYSDLLDDASTRNLDLFLQLFDKQDYIFIMYENVGFIDSHFLEYEKIKNRGYKVGIGTFDDIIFKEGEAFFNGNKIDVIRFSVSPGRLNSEQINQLKSTNLRYINTPDLAGMGDKSLLEGIDNPMIMKTMVLNENIKPEVVCNKDKYVIKPTNKDEGNGVYMSGFISKGTRRTC